MGTHRVGLNGYPLKQAGQGVKRVFWNGFLNGAGLDRAGQNPTQTAPLPSLTRKDRIDLLVRFFYNKNQIKGSTVYLVGHDLLDTDYQLICLNLLTK